MVKQYLEKIQNDLFVKKIEIKNQIMDLNNQYKETIEMIKLLEEADDPTFDAFTPRQVNNFNRSKVAELKEIQIYLYLVN
jgi:two-component system sensor histidine kinase DegS